MKGLFVLLALATVALADEFDYANVKPRDIKIPLPFGLEDLVFSDRIVGGEEAVPNSIPYQVGMFINVGQNTFFCGGSLISRRFVLTAAHCVEGASQVEVRLGGHQIQNAAEHTIIRTNRFTIHAGWNSLLIRNDIAVVDLLEEIPLSNNIQIVGLPRFSDLGNTFAGQSGRISGWGLPYDGASAISPVLRQVVTPVITNFVCNIRFLGVIQDTHVCTDGEGGRGACSGDSGGPLVVGNTQIGIVSFGLGLGCEIGWPSAFTRVTHFLDFIAANTDVVIAN